MIIEKYFATWCQPCKLMDPMVSEVANEFDIKITKIDIDKNIDKAQEEGVRSVPTLIFRDDEGEELTRFVGLTPKGTLVKKLEELV